MQTWLPFKLNDVEPSHAFDTSTCRSSQKKRLQAAHLAPRNPEEGLDPSKFAHVLGARPRLPTSVGPVDQETAPFAQPVLSPWRSAGVEPGIFRSPSGNDLACAGAPTNPRDRLR